MAGQGPTRRQLEVLRAYIRAGSIAAAAHELGISETTARQHLSGLYRRTGYLNAAQAAYLLGAADARQRVAAYSPAYASPTAPGPAPVQWDHRIQAPTARSTGGAATRGSQVRRRPSARP